MYTGYLDVDDGAKHMFFYFFESRRDPATGDECCEKLKLFSDLCDRRCDDVDKRRYSAERHSYKESFTAS